MNSIRGRVHKFERSNIDTDVIIPGQYLKIHDPVELAKHAMEGLDPEFALKVSAGDIMLCGKNFGCGSSREHAPIALSQLGIKAILAPSFARIFYRNAIDGGYLLPIEIEEPTLTRISNNDEVKIDLPRNIILNLTRNESYKMKPFPELVAKIVQAGGLVNLNNVEERQTS
ncbi:MAG TPA: 3-isopropylmalate dehydratase small subunit [Candidatus Nitrosopolaris sp.]|nr:3-isopropylmalate dehydratase small subunit [Candidatus Nitrosopolaris sp.]